MQKIENICNRIHFTGPLCWWVWQIKNQGCQRAALKKNNPYPPLSPCFTGLDGGSSVREGTVGTEMGESGWRGGRVEGMRNAADPESEAPTLSPGSAVPPLASIFSSVRWG